MKFLISRPDKIGDVILALHGVKQLKKLLPEARVYLHVAEYTSDLVQNISFVDGTVTVGEDLEPYNFDAVVDLMAKFHTARQYIGCSIPTRIGNSARWFSFLYTRTRYIRRSHALMNEAEHNWQLISLLDPRLKNKRLTESLQLSDFVSYQDFEGLTDYFALMPGISVSAEAWQINKWGELADQLVEQTDSDVLFILGPAEFALLPQLEKAVSAATSGRVHFKKFDDLKLVIGVLKKARAYVGPSTGITHLASAVGTSGVGLYPVLQSMHPNRWQPFQSSLKICSPAAAFDAEDISRILTHTAEDTPAQTPFLSAFIICKNEERNIRRALESIKWCDEILIVDSGSTDRTLEICREYPRVRIIEKDWPGHREQKQFALEQCRGSWVLNIDSDEEVSTELRAHIQRILALPVDKRDRIHGYFICRVVYFLERWWDRGGWYPEYRMRFFQKKYARWGGDNPHEKAFVDGPKRKLAGSLYHFTYSGIGDLIHTLNNFSTNSAGALYERGQRATVYNIIFHPLFRFFKFFVLKRGYREGLVGFIVACSQAFYTFLKYVKLWEQAYIARMRVADSTRERAEDAGESPSEASESSAQPTIPRVA